MLRHLLVVSSVALSLGAFPAGLFAQQLLDSVSKDFGSVPRGTLLTHQFKLANSSNQPLHVASIRTSCTCISANLAKHDLAPGESTVLVVSVDTSKFLGSKTFTVYLTVERPFLRELQVVVSASSREDVTLTPGQLNFGRIRHGSSAKASVVVEYYGPSSWQIVGVENDNGYLLPEVRKLERGSGPVAYQLEVRLRDDIPVGCWHSDIFLKTNDPNMPRIRVPLLVEVEGNLTATPATVVFGTCKVGSSGEKRVAIRGKEAFKIVRIEGTDEVLQVAPRPDEAKTVHVLQLTLKPASGGEINRRVRVVTDLGKGETVDFTVQAVVEP
ncbi:MAG: DUF1573 domain-containing protein [Gemmatales bacterium]|nr:DUF1573 domain-containing protein [Gemmatales bacterium]MDW8386861.1 DUF1573 domain-containing protein [Gemmatales bacterium]